MTKYKGAWLSKCYLWLILLKVLIGKITMSFFLKVSWLVKGIKPYFQLRPFSIILTIAYVSPSRLHLARISKHRTIKTEIEKTRTGLLLDLWKSFFEMIRVCFFNRQCILLTKYAYRKIQNLLISKGGSS